jgi:hypothetical protein
LRRTASPVGGHVVVADIIDDDVAERNAIINDVALAGKSAAT